MKIPFGKFKGKDFTYLNEYDENEYVEWLSEKCYEMIESKHPEFLKYLEDNFYCFKKLKFKTSSNNEHCGVLINNFDEFRDFVTDVYSNNWKKIKEEDLYKTFGKPKQYPFLAVLFQNKLNVFDGKELQKIYISNKPTVYFYRESMYG